MGPGESLIAALGLSPHPEGGWYRRTWESPVTLEGRPIGSAILYLLLAGERSAPHRIDATEIWHFYTGSPLTLTLDEVPGPATVVTLGPDVAAGQQPQHAWAGGPGSRPSRPALTAWPAPPSARRSCSRGSSFVLPKSARADAAVPVHALARSRTSSGRCRASSLCVTSCGSARGVSHDNPIMVAKASGTVQMAG